MRLIAPVLAILMLVPTVARAVYVEGKNLDESCTKPAIVSERNFCTAYIAGFLDAFEVLQSGEGVIPTICVPTSKSMDDIVGVVRKYAEHHPDHRNKAAAVLVGLALHEAFPCKPQP